MDPFIWDLVWDGFIDMLILALIVVWAASRLVVGTKVLPNKEEGKEGNK